MGNFLNELKLPAMVVIVISIVYLTALIGGTPLDDTEAYYYPAQDPQLFRRALRQARQAERERMDMDDYVSTDPDPAFPSER